jgi:peroxiredoxin
MDGRCFIVPWRNAGWCPPGKANLFIKQSTIDTPVHGMSLSPMKSWIFFFLILSWVQVANAVRVGDEAPEFTLKDVRGNLHQLSGYPGRIVVLEWVHHGCPFVKKHYESGNMQALQAKYTEKDVIWLGIRTGQADTKSLLEQNKNLKIRASATLLDPSGKAAGAYGARATPHIFVISSNGKLAYSGAVDDQPTPDPKTIKGARNYVAEALDALLAGKQVVVKATRPYGCGVKYTR